MFFFLVLVSIFALGAIFGSAPKQAQLPAAPSPHRYFDGESEADWRWRRRSELERVSFADQRRAAALRSPITRTSRRPRSVWEIAERIREVGEGNDQ